MADVAVPSRVDVLVELARRDLQWRPGPADLATVVADGGLAVDIRPAAQRERDGELPGAVVIERNVLEWRLDPTSPHRIREATGADQTIVVVCDEGYASTLAAVGLRRLGLPRATDLAGGYQEWRSWAAASGAAPGVPS